MEFGINKFWKRTSLKNHPSNMVSTHPALYSNNKPYITFADKMYFNEFKEVVMGNDVLIGEGALVLCGVEMGDGAIVASRSVVTEDVKPCTIVGGCRQSSSNIGLKRES